MSNRYAIAEAQPAAPEGRYAGQANDGGDFGSHRLCPESGAGGGIVGNVDYNVF